MLTARPSWSHLLPGRLFRTTGAENNFGSFRQPELTARFELGVWLSVRQTDSVSLLLGRRPFMLGTNPVGYIFSLCRVLQLLLLARLDEILSIVHLDNFALALFSRDLDYVFINNGVICNAVRCMVQNAELGVISRVCDEMPKACCLQLEMLVLDSSYAFVFENVHVIQ
ncbi:hypothetical protein COCSADRAFT_321912 [Bipolaris sorokiniana ND90Pr]|uniref:Uncharacterized protein n=1 Tax=Cochliobolus sativus (strain ND90Pr / ATCC 201652) TaxID=665912 RepID=M2RBE9_COCSN|nr:uncharacterized protein COCSADRAFT_321912 [Bipolaris sorokiniana ND90Pr]EMD64159.1 hypothetical protein COCSADRAFT_321912 [Bipolaris sorokiniana ND90Pr]